MIDLSYFIELLQTHLFLLLFCVGIFSLFVGSLLNVVIYRLPIILKSEWEADCRQYLNLGKEFSEKKNHFSLWFPLSHCPNCKNFIKPWCNIPIVSYLLLKGKCFDCKRSISLRYPFIEFITATLSILFAYHFGANLTLLAALPFLYLLIALIAIDLDHQLLPDELTFSLLWLGLFVNIFNLFTTTQDAILGAILGYLVFYLTQKTFYLFTGKIGLGQGDYKLLAALGAWLGWKYIPFIILISSLLGLVASIPQILKNSKWRHTAIPFGPYLAIAGMLCLCFGKEILLGYFNYVS